METALITIGLCFYIYWFLVKYVFSASELSKGFSIIKIVVVGILKLALSIAVLIGGLFILKNIFK